MLGLRVPHNGVMNLACPANRSAALNKGCIGWWLTLPNNRRSTIWPDIIGKNNGTLTSMDPTTDWGLNRPMRPGGWGCFDTDGTNDYVTISFTAFNSATTVSLAFWVYKAASGDNAFCGAGDSGNTDRWGMQWFGTTMYIVDRGGFPSASVTASGWHHVVITLDTTLNPANRMYFDGAERSLGANTSTTLDASTNVLWVGQSANGNFGPGRWDDLRAYNRVLTAVEAKQLYDASRFGYKNELNWVRRPWAYKPAATFDPAAFPYSNQEGSKTRPWSYVDY